MENKQTIVGEKPIILKKVASKKEVSEKDNCEGYLIDANEKEVRSVIASLKSQEVKKLIAVCGKDDVFNRRMLEKTQIDFLVSPEAGKRKDGLKQRDSGLNHVLAKIAQKNKISIVINFSEINSIKDRKEKALRLGRVLQNIKVCRRAGCKIKIIVEKDADIIGLRAWAFSLGMSSQQVGEVLG